MSDLETIPLHWNADASRWERINWDDFVAFRAISEPFKPLPGIHGGIHYFAVCVCEAGETVNIIGHKYLVDPDGCIGAANFEGWTREELADYRRLMTSIEEKPGDAERLNEIRAKGEDAYQLPRESFYPLLQALPFPLGKNSAAERFLDTLHSQS
jgi:hypothetical protein